MTLQFIGAVVSSFYYIFIFCATSALVFAAIVDYRHNNNKKIQFSECEKSKDNDVECDEHCRKNVENIAKNNYF